MTAFPDQAASDYDQRLPRLVPGYACAIELMAATLAARFTGPCRILVVGCGTGAEVLALSEALPEARITALDPSAGMLDAARNKLRAAGAEDRVTFVHGFLADLPTDLANGRYDAATLSLVLHFLPDDGAKAALLAAIGARLRGGAPLLLLDPLLLDVADDAALAAWLRQRGHEEAAAATVLDRMQRQWCRLTPDRLNGLLAEAGFGDTRLFFQALGFSGLNVTKGPAEHGLAY